jgi:hypothetical protein
MGWDVPGHVHRTLSLQTFITANSEKKCSRVGDLLFQIEGTQMYILAREIGGFYFPISCTHPCDTIVKMPLSLSGYSIYSVDAK